MREQIISGRLKPGDKLPPERELCKGFGVGRGTIREAMTAMSVIGMVERRQDGTYVRDAIHWQERTENFDLIMAKVSIHDVLETREALELDIAVMAAERATP